MKCIRLPLYLTANHEQKMESNFVIINQLINVITCSNVIMHTALATQLVYKQNRF